jgi:hypothetical protein
MLGRIRVTAISSPPRFIALQIKDGSAFHLALLAIKAMKNKAAQQLGRLGGLKTSKAKAAAAKANGKKGGRPKKKP